MTSSTINYLAPLKYRQDMLICSSENWTTDIDVMRTSRCSVDDDVLHDAPCVAGAFHLFPRSDEIGSGPTRRVITWDDAPSAPSCRSASSGPASTSKLQQVDRPGAGFIMTWPHTDGLSVKAADRVQTDHNGWTRSGAGSWTWYIDVGR